MWATINKAPQIVTAIPLPAVNSVYFGVVDESSLARTLSTLRAILLAASAATTAAAAALGWRASRRLTRPLRAVTAAAAQIGAGRLDTHLDEEADPDLSRLVVSFNAMVDSLSERIDRDARFAADVSHELRSPLTTLRTSVGVLEGRRNELTERGQSALDLMTGELTRFERLVEDLLEMSRLDAEQQPPVSEPIRICELVLNLVQQPEYAGTAINVDSRAVDCVVMADKVRLVQAVRNILDNARNHAGGITEVLIRHPDDNVTITVDDSGPGVPPADQDRIFERFARGRSASRRGSGGGSGLGLALVREHVHRHGGEVRVELRPTGGSRFIIELPVAQP
jgi:signal transduction histidine kinase